MSMELAELIFATTAEFADVLGTSDSYVRRLKREGKLVVDDQGRIVVAASVAKLGRVLDPARGGDRSGKAKAPATMPAPTGYGDGAERDRLNYNIQAAREKLAAAQLRELELGREAGALVLRSERDAAEFGRARAAREALLSLPDKCASRCKAAPDVASVYAILMEECRRICRDMATLPDAEADQGADAIEAAA